MDGFAARCSSPLQMLCSDQMPNPTHPPYQPIAGLELPTSLDGGDIAALLAPLLAMSPHQPLLRPQPVPEPAQAVPVLPQVVPQQPPAAAAEPLPEAASMGTRKRKAPEVTVAEDLEAAAEDASALVPPAATQSPKRQARAPTPAAAASGLSGSGGSSEEAPRSRTRGRKAVPRRADAEGHRAPLGKSSAASEAETEAVTADRGGNPAQARAAARAKLAASKAGSKAGSSKAAPSSAPAAPTPRPSAAVEAGGKKQQARQPSKVERSLWEFLAGGRLMLELGLPLSA